MEGYIMFLKKTPKPNGTYLAITESYYDKTKKCTRQKTIQGLGYLEELRQQYPDPIAHFEQTISQMNQERENNKNATILIDLTASMAVGMDHLKNVGYGALKQIYKDLQLDIFWRVRTQKRSIQYDMEQAFRLLVLSRALFPASKKQTFEKRGIYFEAIDGFSLDDLYHSLDLIDEYQEDLQKWIYEHSSRLFQRDLSVAYFDCTNYYFDIGRPDVDLRNENGETVDQKGNATEVKYRKRGPEKNRRPDPIVEMGLLMDRNGIPLAYDLFPGNESEKVHMRPIINRIKKDYTDTRIIFVADRGLNTSDNIYYLNGDNKGEHNQRDGYVYGQSVRGADAEFKKWVLKKGYVTDKVTDEHGGELDFQHKSRIHPKCLHVNVSSADGTAKKKKEVMVDQKQMVYYSEKYARKQRLERQTMVERAKDLIEHPHKYDRVTCAGSASYIKNISFSKKTGEIIKGRDLSLNLKKIEEEAKFDGYYAIVTSELEMGDHELRNIYRGLARIEEMFKISKSDFSSRPVHVRTNPHIDAHFATCFTALVLICLLQARLGNQFPVGRVLDSLRSYNCVQIDRNMYQFIYYDEILEACGEAFGIDLKNQYRSQIQIRRMLRY